MFPLKKYTRKVPLSIESGGFGHVRKHDIHCGIDLYCNDSDEVFSIENGVVVAILPFTGEHADSPWWNNTFCVMIEGNSGVINYGEVVPGKSIFIGKSVSEGEILGNVVRVLKSDKGLPMDMLHLELYKAGTKEPVWWYINEKQPEELLNPYDLLINNILP